MTRRADPKTDSRIIRAQRAVDAVDNMDPTVQVGRAVVDAVFSDETDEDKRDDKFRMPRTQLRPNTESLTLEQIEKARMVQASKQAFKKGFGAAQADLDATSLRGWTIDTELSTEEGLVLRKGQTTKIAYRGTEWSNIQDVVTDAAVAAGLEEKAPQIRSSRLQLEAVRQKYGALPTELIGYSKGGGHAMHLGDAFKIPTTSFNPLVGRKQITTTSDTPHTIIRTTEDPVSTLMALAKKKNYNVKSIDPIKGLGDLKSVHSLSHFTSAGARQPGGIETLMREGVAMGQQLAQLETLDVMKSGVEAGKSFTRTLDEFNRTNGQVQRIDVLDDGSLGPRIHRDAGSVKLWKSSGGTFSASEQAHLDKTPTPPQRQYSAEARAMGIGQELTTGQIDYVNSLDTQQRNSFMQGQRQALQKHTNSMDATVKPHEQVIRSIMPKTSSLATGAIAGLGAHALMNAIDPNHKMNAVAAEATEGAIAGAMGVAGASALGATAALGPEVLAGAAAYMAGAESSKAITNALVRGGMNAADAEGIGSVSGGAVGGVTAAGVSAGATILGSMALGAEWGDAIGIVGGPIGMALGTAIGGALGGIVGGLGYLIGGAGHHEEPPPPPEYIARTATDGMFGVNQYQQHLATEQAIEEYQERQRQQVESYGMEQSALQNRVTPGYNAATLAGQIMRGRTSIDYQTGTASDNPDLKRPTRKPTFFTDTVTPAPAPATTTSTTSSVTQRSGDSGLRVGRQGGRG